MRGRGIAGIKAQQEKAKRLKQMGAELESNLVSDLKAQFNEFKASLEAFAVKNKKQINDDPVFRRQFHQMCLEIGVDPISSQKAHLGGTLGLGHFYYELGIQVINVCIALKKKTGGGGSVTLISGAMLQNKAPYTRIRSWVARLSALLRIMRI